MNKIRREKRRKKENQKNKAGGNAKKVIFSYFALCMTKTLRRTLGLDIG